MSSKIQKLYNTFTNLEPFVWLAGRSYSDAFVICLGAGPWKFKRRQYIQGLSLDILDGRDLSKLDVVDWYPLNWQNKYGSDMVAYLKKSDQTMQEFCDKVYHRQTLYTAIGHPKGCKVLSLFCRDALKIPAFPIDRHVKRLLFENGLPTTEEEIIFLCSQNNIDPYKMAIGCVRAASMMDNPDWKRK